MTDNSQLKMDASELLRMVDTFKRRYPRVMQFGIGTPIQAFERELRMVLFILRTDEENAAQYEQDSMC